MKKEEILKKLRDAGDYVSGQELCEHYGVSRTAIWKAIRQLEKDGYIIEAQNNRGYRLVEHCDADLFSKIEIEDKLFRSRQRGLADHLYFIKKQARRTLMPRRLRSAGKHQAQWSWRTCRPQGADGLAEAGQRPLEKIST